MHPTDQCCIWHELAASMCKCYAGSAKKKTAFVSTGFGGTGSVLYIDSGHPSDWHMSVVSITYEKTAVDAGERV